jgi:hypothetical protein
VGPSWQRGRERRRGAGLARVVAGLVLPGSAQWLALFFFFCSETFSIFYFQFCLIYLFDTNLFGFEINFNLVKLWQLCPGVCQTNNVLFGEV